MMRSGSLNKRIKEIISPSVLSLNHKSQTKTQPLVWCLNSNKISPNEAFKSSFKNRVHFEPNLNWASKQEHWGTKSELKLSHAASRTALTSPTFSDDFTVERRGVLQQRDWRWGWTWSTDGTGCWDGPRRVGVTVTSLDQLKVVQDGHDVLRHEDVAGVDGHGSHRDEQRVWGGTVEEELCCSGQKLLR